MNKTQILQEKSRIIKERKALVCLLLLIIKDIYTVQANYLELGIPIDVCDYNKTITKIRKYK
jgi:hypothetical protein